MSKIKYLITGFITTFVLFISEASAINTTKEVILSDPIGGSILPGGKLLGDKGGEGMDIKTSFIFSKLVPFLIKYAIRLAVALAVIALIIGGYQYMTAYGDEEKHKNAQKTIMYAIIGLVLAITAFGIVSIITKIKLT